MYAPAGTVDGPLKYPERLKKMLLYQRRLPQGHDCRSGEDEAAKTVEGQHAKVMAEGGMFMVDNAMWTPADVADDNGVILVIDTAHSQTSTLTKRAVQAMNLVDRPFFVEHPNVNADEHAKSTVRA